MTALSANRLTESKSPGDTKLFPMAASTTIYAGSMVCLNSAGYAVPAAALAGNKGVIGVAVAKVVNSGSAGDTNILVQEGLFKFAGATLAQSNVGSLMFAADDQTVDDAGLIDLPIAGPLVEYVGASEGWVYCSWKRSDFAAFGTFCFQTLLATLANGDFATNWTPGFAGILVALRAIVNVPATTAAKAASLNVEIGTTDVTGTLALTSANMTPLGAVVSQALTGGVYFGATDTLSIEVASVTSFVEGSINLQLVYKQLGF